VTSSGPMKTRTTYVKVLRGGANKPFATSDPADHSPSPLAFN
jgi:hypothetical protein